MILLLALPAFAVSRDEVLARAQAWVDANVPYSYSSWYTDPTTGSCCYRTDCSGFVSAVWGLDAPGHTTYSFAGGPWDDGVSYVIDASELQAGDALNYPGDPDAGTGHVMLYVDGDFWSGWVEVYEEYSSDADATFRWRSIDPSSYLPIRYVGIDDCTDEVCDGADNDCDGVADDGFVCEVPDEPAIAAWRSDPAASTDVDGDGRADLCARASSGVVCSLASGASFSTLGALSNEHGYTEIDNYSSVRFADVNGDGRADACGRSDTEGFACWLSTGSAFATEVPGPEMTAANGWSDVTNYATLRMADIDGDGRADLCGRGDAGFYCWRSDGVTLTTEVVGPEWSDAVGWSAAQYYSTIRMADVNGDGLADVCARNSARFDCWLSDGDGFPTQVLGPDISDALGWAYPQYYTTIAMPDLDGDGRADMCARGGVGYYCWRSEGTSFSAWYDGPALSNAAGWDQYAYYSTLRWGDIDGDGDDDVCGRGVAGWYCWRTKADGFSDAIAGPALSDGNGWSDYANFSTIELADVNADGMADVCARGDTTVACWLSDGNGFPTQVGGPEWSDASGWGSEMYYATFRAAGGGVVDDVDPGDSGEAGGGDSGGGGGGGGPGPKGGGKAEIVPEADACGCASGRGAGGLLAVLAALVALRRRRGAW